MAGDDRVALYERALYAALTGNLNCLLKVVDSWEDALWAYCRALVDQRTEEAMGMYVKLFGCHHLQIRP